MSIVSSLNAYAMLTIQFSAMQVFNQGGIMKTSRRALLLSKPPPLRRSRSVSSAECSRGDERSSSGERGAIVENIPLMTANAGPVQQSTPRTGYRAPRVLKLEKPAPLSAKKTEQRGKNYLSSG